MASMAPEVLPRLHNDLHDLLTMLGILLAFVVPPAIAKVRHASWRRRVLAACR